MAVTQIRDDQHQGGLSDFKLHLRLYFGYRHLLLVDEGTVGTAEIPDKELIVSDFQCQVFPAHLLSE